MSVLKLPHPVLSILGLMCPQVTWSLPSMPSVLMLINTNTASQKVKNLKCLYPVRSDVFC